MLRRKLSKSTSRHNLRGDIDSPVGGLSAGPAAEFRVDGRASLCRNREGLLGPEKNKREK